MAKQNPPIVDKKTANEMKPDLPPAGPKRDDELIQRMDGLQQAIEELKGPAADRVRIPEGALKPERELQHLIRDEGALHVSDRDPEFDYCWVYVGRQQQKVWEKKSMLAPGMTSTWHVVQGEMKEAREFMAEDTTRRVGDTILMRIRKDQHEIWLKANESRKRMQVEGVTSTLQELGSKHRDNFIVHTDQEDSLASGRSMMDVVGKRAGVRRAFAKQVAGAELERQIRTGTVPGMELDVNEQTTRRRLGYA